MNAAGPGASGAVQQEPWSLDDDIAALFRPFDDHVSDAVSQLVREARNRQQANAAVASAELSDRFGSSDLPAVGWDLSRYLNLLASDVVRASPVTASPRCLAHMTPPVPAILPSLAALVAALNQNLVRADASTAMALCERQVLAMLHRVVFGERPAFYARHAQSRSSTLGLLVSGGTLANVTAMWCARNAAPGLRPGSVRRLGLTEALRRAGYARAVIVGPATLHYSFPKAADLLGLGAAGLVRVPVDVDDRMDISALTRVIRRCRARGDLVLAVVGVGGTTNSGAIDRLDAVADVARDAGAHFHVDAAWGGPVLLSPTSRHRLAGIERADTVTLDGHKQLYLPVGSGVLLLRNAKLARHVEHTADYAVRPGSADLGRRSIEGSRPGTALLLHAALHLLGRNGYRELVDSGLRQAAYFAAAVCARPEFELLHHPQLNIVLYRYLPPSMRTGAELDARVDVLNTAIQRRQRSAGRALVSRTRAARGSGRRARRIVALRAVLANPFTTQGDIEAILDEQAWLGQQLVRCEMRETVLRA